MGEGIAQHPQPTASPPQWCVCDTQSNSVKASPQRQFDAGNNMHPDRHGRTASARHRRSQAACSRRLILFSLRHCYTGALPPQLGGYVRTYSDVMTLDIPSRRGRRILPLSGADQGRSSLALRGHSPRRRRHHRHLAGGRRGGFRVIRHWALPAHQRHGPRGHLLRCGHDRVPGSDPGSYRSSHWSTQTIPPHLCCVMIPSGCILAMACSRPELALSGYRQSLVRPCVLPGGLVR